MSTTPYEAAQLQLPFLDPLVQVAYPDRATIQERFDLFHAANPQVYRALVATTRWLLARYNISHISIKLPYEMVRWTRYLITEGGEVYKLSNDFTSRYARLIMSQEPDLATAFDTRDLRSK